jgi:hypothetical protein
MPTMAARISSDSSAALRPSDFLTASIDRQVRLMAKLST